MIYPAFGPQHTVYSDGSANWTYRWRAHIIAMISYDPEKNCYYVYAGPVWADLFHTLEQAIDSCEQYLKNQNYKLMPDHYRTLL